MNHILRIAQHRADLAAAVEYLEGMVQDGDVEEQKAHASAVRSARRAYHFAEQQFQSATSTLSDRELASLGIQRAA